MKRSTIREHVATEHRIAHIELGRWIRNSRLIVAIVLLVFIREFVGVPLIQCSEDMQSSLNLFEPMIAIVNSDLLMLLLPVTFLVLISDYPQNGAIGVFYHIRTTKRTWVLGQMLFAGLAAIMFTLLIMLYSCLMVISRVELSGSFSRAVMQYGTRFPEQSNGVVARLLPRNIFNQMSLWEALFHSITLLFLFLWMISMVLLLCGLFHRRVLGILLALVLIVGGASMAIVQTKVMWAFPVANAIGWLHFREYLSEPIFPLWGSYLYFGGMIGTLAVVSWWMASRYQPGRN